MAVLLENNAAGRLALNINTTQTTITLQSGNGSLFPNPSAGDWFPLTIIGDEGDFEIVHCTSRTGDNLTITRGAEGTQARAFNSGNICELRLTKESLAAVQTPSGVITLWSGAVNAVPAGWALCDGSNGTPNLRDRFIVGAGGDYGVGDTGGAANVTLTAAQMPAHNHSVTVNSGGSHNHSASTGSAGSHSHSGSASSAGAHTHGIQMVRSTSGGSNYFPRDKSAWDQWSNAPGLRTTSAGAHTHSLSINSNGAHTHTVSVADGGAHTHGASSANTGGGGSHENRPPFYALAYIMKL